MKIGLIFTLNCIHVSVCCCLHISCCYFLWRAYLFLVPDPCFRLPCMSSLYSGHRGVSVYCGRPASSEFHGAVAMLPSVSGATKRLFERCNTRNSYVEMLIFLVVLPRKWEWWEGCEYDSRNFINLEPLIYPPEINYKT